MTADTPPPQTRPTPPPASDTMLLAALFLIGLNLRTTMASLPPLLAHVQRDLGLNAAAAGLLTGLPVACMGLAAPTAHRLTRATSTSTAAGVALAAVTGGLALRLLGATRPILYTATLLAGIGIAILGTVLPGIIKQRLPNRAGTATAVYASAMAVGSAVAAGLAVPLASLLGGWPRSLATWGPAHRRRPDHVAGHHPPRPPPRSRRRQLRGTTVAQPHRLAGRRLPHRPVGAVLQLPGLAGPRLRGARLVASGRRAATVSLRRRPARRHPRRPRRRPSRRPPPAAVRRRWRHRHRPRRLLTVPDLSPLLLVAVLGAGLGAGFALGLLLLVDHAATPADSTQLSAMAFLVSYTLAAWGPTLTGVLRDATGGFQAPLAVLLAVSLAQLAIAYRLTPHPW